MTWKRQAEEERMNVDLKKEDALYRSKWKQSCLHLQCNVSGDKIVSTYIAE